MKSVVYIAHRLSDPDSQQRAINLRNAGLWVQYAVLQGVAPEASWMVIAQQFEETPENRKRGMALDEMLLRRCDELWLCGGIIAPGMRDEIAIAESLLIPVLDLSHLGALPPGIVLTRDTVPCPALESEGVGL